MCALAPFLVKRIKSICIVAMIYTGAIGQETNLIDFENPGDGAGISAICKKSGNNIIIRWAPNDEGIWLKSLEGLVRIERTTFQSFAERNETNTILLESSLRPWSSAKIEQEIIAHPHRKEYIMAGSILYGDWESIDSTAQEINMRDISNRYEELVNRYSNAILLADVSKSGAEALGLRWVDTDVPDANFISYRITLLLPDGTYYQTSTLYNKAMDVEAIPSIGASEEMDGFVRISWDRKSHGSFFTAYYIERSKEGKTYERLNKLPFINAEDARESFGPTPISYRAEAANGVAYFYRVIGLDAFGEESTPSEPVKLTAKDLTPPPAPQNVTASANEEGYMEVKWSQDSIPSDFRGYMLLKSMTFDGSFEVISDTLQSDQYSFLDKSPSLYGNTYFKVCALDISGNQACSQPVYGIMVDTFAPASPMGLEGSIDSTGIVTLQWLSNNEPDLDGYYIYFSNRADQTYHRINTQPIKVSTFTDTLTLSTLTKEIYYKIAAVDIRSNISAFSDPIKVMKPDTIPPAPALLEKYEINEEGIRLFWINSNSRDVVTHELMRKTDTEDWAVLAAFYTGEYTFLDTNVINGKTYEYAIRALDDAGLRSTPTRTFKIPYPYRTDQVHLKMQLSLLENAIEIALLPDTNPETIESIWLYRMGTGEKFRKLAVLRDHQYWIFSDDQVKPDNQYTYKYRVEYKNGLKSPYSADYTIQYLKNEH